MIDGKNVVIGGKLYVMPPLNLKGMRKCIDLLPLIGQMNEQGMNALATTITVSLQRNYPELTQEEVEDAVQFDDIEGLANAFVEVNKLAPKQKGAAEGAAAP